MDFYIVIIKIGTDKTMQRVQVNLCHFNLNRSIHMVTHRVSAKGVANSIPNAHLVMPKIQEKKKRQNSGHR